MTAASTTWRPLGGRVAVAAAFSVSRLRCRAPLTPPSTPAQVFGVRPLVLLGPSRRTAGAAVRRGPGARGAASTLVAIEVRRSARRASRRCTRARAGRRLSSRWREAADHPARRRRTVVITTGRNALAQGWDHEPAGRRPRRPPHARSGRRSTMTLLAAVDPSTTRGRAWATARCGVERCDVASASERYLSAGGRTPGSGRGRGTTAASTSSASRTPPVEPGRFTTERAPWPAPRCHATGLRSAHPFATPAARIVCHTGISRLTTRAVISA